MLQVEYIDLVILHGPMRPGECFEGQVGERNSASCGDLTVRVDPGDEGRQESWRALESTVRRGIVRAVGVSNFRVNHLEAIRRVATLPISVNQVALTAKVHDDALIAYCHAHGITLQAFAPLGSPILGKGFVPDSDKGFLVRTVRAFEPLRTAVSTLLGGLSTWTPQHHEVLCTSIPTSPEA